MTPRLRKCDESTIAGRLAKAEQFLQGAEIIREFAADEQDIADAYVTLCVHCGVAAADVICCIALGGHVQGEDHNEAVTQLSKVWPPRVCGPSARLRSRRSAWSRWRG